MAEFDPPLRFARPLLPDFDKVCGRMRPHWAEGSVTKGELTAEYEKAAAVHIRSKHAVAVSSCTVGLMAALKALDLEGDCLVPAFTFTATAQAVLWNGLKPVFADCHPARFTVTPETLEASLTPATSAVIATYVFGNPPPLDAIALFCAQKKLKLILDAAHALGTLYRGNPAGARGNAEVFSTSATKLLCTGEGGIVATRDPDLADRVRGIREYGHASGYEAFAQGLNGRMTEFQAAMGLEGLPLLEEHAERRNRLAEAYRNALSGLPFAFQEIEPECRSSYKDFAVLLGDEWRLSRDTLAQRLEDEGIPVKKYFFPPLHTQKFFADRGVKPVNLPATERIASRILCLPMFHHLTETDIRRIVETLTRIFRNQKKTMPAVP